MEKDYQEICICRKCPTYVDCKEPVAYCLTEDCKSKCIIKQLGCICPTCPVYIEKKFSNMYYCFSGNIEPVK